MRHDSCGHEYVLIYILKACSPSAGHLAGFSGRRAVVQPPVLARPPEVRAGVGLIPPPLPLLYVAIRYSIVYRAVSPATRSVRVPAVRTGVCGTRPLRSLPPCTTRPCPPHHPPSSFQMQIWNGQVLPTDGICQRLSYVCPTSSLQRSVSAR